EVRAQPRLAVTQRRLAGAGVELGVAQEAGAAEGPAHVLLEVLDLVEVAGPVDPPLAGAAPAQQADGPPQALAPVGEVPDAPVLAAVEVTARAGEIAVAAHAGVGRVVEDLLALEHGRR